LHRANVRSSHSVSTNSDGRRTVSYSESEQVVNGFTLNDVSLTSDHPFRSVIRIGRGAGYTQYGGLPVIVGSTYHMSGVRPRFPFLA